MKKPPPPQPTGGTSGPRRPRPVAQWRRTPAADLLRVPEIGNKHRLKILGYLPPDVLPNNARRLSNVQYSFLMTVGGEYDIQAQVERGAAGTVLAIETHAYDRRRDRWEPFDCPPALQAQAFRQAGQEFLRDSGRRYASAEGRN